MLWLQFLNASSCCYAKGNRSRRSFTDLWDVDKGLSNLSPNRAHIFRLFTNVQLSFDSNNVVNTLDMVQEDPFGRPGPAGPGHGSRSDPDQWIRSGAFPRTNNLSTWPII